jgi:hypothetical protein
MDRWTGPHGVSMLTAPGNPDKTWLRVLESANTSGTLSCPRRKRNVGTPVSRMILAAAAATPVYDASAGLAVLSTVLFLLAARPSHSRAKIDTPTTSLVASFKAGREAVHGRDVRERSASASHCGALTPGQARLGDRCTVLSGPGSQPRSLPLPGSWFSSAEKLRRLFSEAASSYGAQQFGLILHNLGPAESVCALAFPDRVSESWAPVSRRPFRRGPKRGIGPRHRCDHDHPGGSVVK